MSIRVDTEVLLNLKDILYRSDGMYLSRQIEAAICAGLFGVQPDLWNLKSSISMQWSRSRHVVRELDEAWKTHQRSGKRFTQSDYANPAFLRLYLIHYFPHNVPKIQYVLWNMLREGKLTEDIRILDIGVGTGTTLLAAIDFLLRLGWACDRSGKQFPIQSFRYVGLDTSRACLAFSGSVHRHYLEATSRSSSRWTFAKSGALSSAYTLALQSVPTWTAVHPKQLSHPVQDSNLLVACNVVVEVLRAEQAGWRGARDSFNDLIGRHPIRSHAVLIEQSSQEFRKGLELWRRSYLRARPQDDPRLACFETLCSIRQGGCFYCRPTFNLRLDESSNVYCFHEALGWHRWNLCTHRDLSWSQAVIRRETDAPVLKQPRGASRQERALNQLHQESFDLAD
jgi:hypothetical protein